MKFKLLPYLVLCLIIPSCGAPFGVQQTPGPNISDMGGIGGAFSPRFDGAYSVKKDTSRFGKPVRPRVVYSPLIFVNDSVAYWDNFSGSNDSTIVKLDYYKDIVRFFQTHVGNFVQRNDTIVAKLPINLYSSGYRQVRFEAYFQGVMLNNDTIIDWHMLQPYPAANPKFNYNFDFFTQPKMLYFVESPELKQLDSLLQYGIIPENR